MKIVMSHYLKLDLPYLLAEAVKVCNRLEILSPYSTSGCSNKTHNPVPNTGQPLQPLSEEDLGLSYKFIELRLPCQWESLRQGS